MSLPPFERVVDDHARVVLRVCRAVLPEHDAQDAAAETFVSALRAYPRLRPDSDVRAWLVTIAHRKALDVLRARTRAAVPVAEVPERASPDTSRDAVDDGVGNGALWAAVRALPEKQRLAVAYRYVADLAYADVGAAMGTSEAAARRSAADGVAALRRRHLPPDHSPSHSADPLPNPLPGPLPSPLPSPLSSPAPGPEEA